MEMQDKEFDELFRSKLDGFETKPSGMVWENISQQLEHKPRYRKLIPYLSIAASIAVLAAASILFIPKKSGVQQDHQPKNTIAKTKVEQPVIKEQAQPEEQAQPVAQPVKKENNAIAYVKQHHTTPAMQTINKSQVTEPQLPAKNDQTILASTAPKVEVTKPVVPEKISLVDRPVVNDASVIAATSQPSATTAPVDDNKPEAVQIKRKRHEREGLGGLLNKLIAKVDKRKDKVIEFTDDADEGESNITGVNLGIFKVKKDKVAK